MGERWRKEKGEEREIEGERDRETERERGRQTVRVCEASISIFISEDRCQNTCQASRKLAAALSPLALSLPLSEFPLCLSHTPPAGYIESILSFRKPRNYN